MVIVDFFRYVFAFERRPRTKPVVPVASSGRRSGTTTRLVDEFVQKFFTEGTVRIYDHYSTIRSDRRILKIFLTRLRIEHGFTKEDIEVNEGRTRNGDIAIHVKKLKKWSI